MSRRRLVLASVAAVAAFAAPAGAERAATTTVSVTTTDYRFALSRSTVPRGTVVFKVTNAGGLPHDFAIAGRRTAFVTPGSTKSVRVVFAAAGRFPYRCEVTGHAEIGMKGVLTVT